MTELPQSKETKPNMNTTSGPRPPPTLSVGWRCSHLGPLSPSRRRTQRRRRWGEGMGGVLSFD
jgi:hypothetical protein